MKRDLDYTKSYKPFIIWRIYYYLYEIIDFIRSIGGEWYYYTKDGYH